MWWPGNDQAYIHYPNKYGLIARTPNGVIHGPLTREAKLRVAHAPGMPGRFSPPPTSKETAGQQNYIFQFFLLHENGWLIIEISLNIVSTVSGDNMPTLFQIITWRRTNHHLNQRWPSSLGLTALTEIELCLLHVSPPTAPITRKGE